MKRAGLKNPAVAAAAGVHEKTVSKWRSDAQSPEERQLAAVAELLREHGVEVSTAYLRYGVDAARPDFVIQHSDGSTAVVEAKRPYNARNADLPRRLELLALDFEKEMVSADVDQDFRHYARARLRDPELLEMYAGGHSNRAMTADEQLADYEDLIDELRGRLKRRLALLKKRGAK